MIDLSGANTYSGATIVAGGALRVTGSTLRSNTIVQAGGTLTGSGAVGNLVSNGVVAPGGPAGKVLYVAGNFIQLPRGVIRSTVASDGTLDRLAIAGHAEVRGGTLQVIGVKTALLDKTLTVIEARDGVTGNFDRARSDSLFALLTPLMQGQRLLVSFERDPRGFGLVARNANQRAVGKAADSLTAGAPVFDRLFHSADLGLPRNRDAIIVGVAMAWDFSRTGTMDLGYGAAFGDRGTDHNVRMTLGWRF